MNATNLNIYKMKKLLLTAIVAMAFTWSSNAQTEYKTYYKPNNGSEWSSNLTGSAGCYKSIFTVSINGRSASSYNYEYRMVVKNITDYPISFTWQWDGEGSANRITVKPNSSYTSSSFYSDDSPTSVNITRVKARRDGKDTRVINCYESVPRS
jgi:hypothetical protein